MRMIVFAILISAGFVPRASRLNLDFESGTVSGAPAGWRMSGAGLQATLVDQDCAQGRHCVMLSGSSGVMYETIATPRRLAQTLGPRPLLSMAAGRRVRFRAAVRVEGAGARLWVRAGAGPYRKSPEITGSGWNYYEVEVEVPPDTRQIVFGFLLSGPGKVWVDDASFVEAREDRRERGIMKA